ncbi:MAG: hypothetical protein AB1473_01015 [Thermodesulfobacteriota bacterium]
MKMLRSHLLLPFPLVVLALLIAGAGPCSGSAQEEEAAAQAVNAFTIDLYKQIREPESCIICCSCGRYPRNAMKYTVARGKHALHIAKALYLDPPNHPGLNKLFWAFSDEAFGYVDEPELQMLQFQSERGEEAIIVFLPPKRKCLEAADESLLIGDHFHKASVQTNEEGTEAIAASSIWMNSAGRLRGHWVR